MTSPQRSDRNLRRQLFVELAPRAHYRAGELADLCDVSLRQLERYFRADFGCSPGQWLREKRIRTACALLDRADSVKEVAYSLGFGSVSHFSSQFKRATGVCPSDYPSGVGRNGPERTDRELGRGPELGGNPGEN